MLLFAYFSMLQFTQVFLETERDMPLVDLVFRILKTIFLVNAIAAIFIGSVSAQIWLSYLSFFVMVMLVVVVTFSWLRGNDCARYCFAGMLFTAISGILYILAINGFIPSTSFLLALVPLGTLTGAMFLSFALADRINFLQAAALDASQLSMASLSKYRALFDNAVEGMYRMSLDGNMVSANLSMAKLLGYDSVNLMLSNREQVSDICYADPISQYRQLNDTGMFQAEIAYKKIGGQKAWGRHSARLIKDGEGKPSHIEGTLVDITARREKEKVEIEREKYRVETDVARSSAAAKSEFLANMSHEIRTPLTAIIGYSESLYDDDLAASDEHDSVEIIIRSSYHLLGLIDDILDFSKIEAHELEVESIDVDIAMLMKDVESYFSMKAASQELYFKVNYDFPLPIKLSADPKRLKQILLNLCSNALKFTKSGGVTIDVGWDAERSLMRFSVEDTGIGLTDAQIGKLFQEYSQADESTARDFGGTGLGLLISKTLAELMGGTIEVVSVPGEGSCFSAYIGGELADKKDWVDAWDTSGVKSKKTASGIVIPQLKGRILYAEDNPVNQKLAEMLIVKTGASLMMVDNGKEAVEAVKDNDFDLILMDVQMPVMSGAEAIKIIRDTGYTLPIVALTANVMQEEVKEYESIGCDDCLAKPIVRAVFYQTLEKYLEKIS
ncbi:MAG: hypothetical protein COA99_00310 [Moraxellaceae bacterium]|nr:MAG: hypothetical protein COA99_00310 [Moraxellaceae bacterium]